MQEDGKLVQSSLGMVHLKPQSVSTNNQPLISKSLEFHSVTNNAEQELTISWL